MKGIVIASTVLLISSFAEAGIFGNSHGFLRGRHRGNSGCVVDRPHYVDLGHLFNNITEITPLATRPFRQTVVNEGPFPFLGNVWLAEFQITMSEHSGTHIDAPYHFNEFGYRMEQVPLTMLMRKDVVVIDIEYKVNQDERAQLLIEDVFAWEREHGKIPRGSYVLLHTGWYRRWGTPEYFNCQEFTGPRCSNFSVPSVDGSVADLLIYRGVACLGVDFLTPETPTPGVQPPVHVKFAAANRLIIENGANFDKLPPTGACISVLPLPFEGGSGSPVRLLAEVDRRHTESQEDDRSD